VEVVAGAEVDILHVTKKTAVTPTIKTNPKKSPKICLTHSLHHLKIDTNHLLRATKADPNTLQTKTSRNLSLKKRTRETAFSLGSLDTILRRRRLT